MRHGEKNIYILLGLGIFLASALFVAAYLYDKCPALSNKIVIFVQIFFIAVGIVSIMQNYISGRKSEAQNKEMLDKINQLLKCEKLINETDMNSDIPATPKRITTQGNRIEDISNDDQLQYEFGKKLLLESASKRDEFCKSMIRTSLSVIPIYIALFKFVRPENNGLQGCYIAPVWMFFLSAIVFTLGYIPTVRNFSRDKLSEITKRHWGMISSWRFCIIAGFALLYLGIILALYVIGVT